MCNITHMLKGENIMMKISLEPKIRNLINPVLNNNLFETERVSHMEICALSKYTDYTKDLVIGLKCYHCILSH